MTDRYSRKGAQAAFERLAEATGNRVAIDGDYHGNHGAWRLDYVAEYGGFNIERIDDVTFGVSMPLGDRRYNAREFCERVRFALDAIKADDIGHRLAACLRGIVGADSHPQSVEDLIECRDALTAWEARR